MKQEHKLKEDEPLWLWCNRLAEAFSLTPEQKEMLDEVRLKSYIRGAITFTTQLKKK